METEIERLRAENEKLKKKQERILRLFGSHVPFDIKIPMSAIQGYTQLLKQDAQDFTEQQLEYLGYIQLATKHLYKIVNFSTDYARYGFEKPELTNPIKIADFEADILKPIAQRFKDQTLTVSKKFCSNVDSCGLLISDLAIQRALDRIVAELFSYYAVDQINLCLVCLEDKFSIQIFVPDELRDEPLDAAIYKNRYEDGEHIDWAVAAIVELYDGSLQYGVNDGMIQIEISFPLVEVDL